MLLDVVRVCVMLQTMYSDTNFILWMRTTIFYVSECNSVLFVRDLRYRRPIRSMTNTALLCINYLLHTKIAYV